MSTQPQVQAPVRMLKVRMTLTAVLQNPDGVFEDEMNADIPEPIADDPQIRRAVCAKFLAQSTSNGLLQRPVGDDTLEAIPMCRVKSIVVNMGKVSRLGISL